jgi:hypothetical protein
MKLEKCRNSGWEERIRQKTDRAPSEQWPVKAQSRYVKEQIRGRPLAAFYLLKDAVNP